MSLNNSYITLIGFTEKEVETVLLEWLSMYKDDLDDKFRFELFKQHASIVDFVLSIDDQLDNDLFFYLVNYFHHSKKTPAIYEVLGFTKGSKVYKKLSNLDLMVYASNEDLDTESVYCVLKNGRTFKRSFSKGFFETEKDKNFSMKQNLTFDTPVKLAIFNKQPINEMIGGEHEFADAKSRFKWFAIILILAMVAGDLLVFQAQFSARIDTILMFMFGGIAWVWFYFDTKLLRFDKPYIQCYVIAGIMFLNVLFLELFAHLNQSEKRLYLIFPVALLILLVIQRPIRLFMMKWMKREPEIMKRGSFGDFIFSIVLPLISIGLAAFIVNGFLA